MSSKTKLLKSKSKEDFAKPMEHSEVSTGHKYLSEVSLPIYRHFSGDHRSAVPPMSPKELMFDYSCTRVPKLLPKLKNLKLPYVREIGIKACIDKLAEYFRCTDYKFNLIQFWFLDIITDCLWRAQDEFQFPEKYQKIILEWVLYVFNLIRASEYNLSRGKVFKLFKEAMLVAEDYIQSGCAMVPLPEELFSLHLEEDKEENFTDADSFGSASSGSTISLESNSEDNSYLAIKFKESTEFFKLPGRNFVWNADDECMSSSEETISEDEKPQLQPRQSVRPVDSDVKETSPEDIEDEEIEYYKPDMKTPPRFKSSHISVVESASISLDISVTEKVSEESGDAVWKDVPRRPGGEPCLEVPLPPKQYKTKSAKSNTMLEPKTDEDVLKAWHDYYLWQKRKEDMADPGVGWSTYNDSKTMKKSAVWDNVDQAEEIKTEWLNYINRTKKEIKEVDESIFINTCVLLAIKQFIFEYFYETFQYSLIRIAFRCHHHLITQSVSEFWHVPKIIKSELKKPKPKKPKKEKKPKEKKPKKDKAVKRTKDKSTKTSKSKSSKEKKEKKVKSKPLTKEEKAELARLKKEQALLEEKKRIAEMNKRFMFPLAHAATDTFYQGIFEDWMKVEKGSKGKKK